MNKLQGAPGGDDFELYDSGSRVDDDMLSNPLVTHADGRRQRMVRVDGDVYAWFAGAGGHLEGHIGAVLRAEAGLPPAAMDEGAAEQLENPVVTYPGGVSQRLVRIDEDVYEHYRAGADDFEWRIGEALRSYCQVRREPGQARGKHAG